MDNVDVVRSNKSPDPPCTEHTERVSDRDIKNVLGRQKVQTRLPLIAGPESDEYIVTSVGKLAAEIDEVTLAAAKSFGRGNLQYPHVTEFITYLGTKKGTPAITGVPKVKRETLI